MKTFNRLKLIALFALAGTPLLSQININVQVKPPYQSRIAEYISRPDLILLTVSNISQTTQRVQLTGSITGDNGVSVKVKPSFKSPSPLLLNPGQVVAMDANMISFLFNYSSIVLTGINQDNLVNNARLPEGVYQLCIRALDYDSGQPLSSDAPMGCSTFFINDIEPPIITAPINESNINSSTAQTFPITWMTPPGANPATQYKVKIVEIIANRNPNDAMLSSTTPSFFEKTVTGMNSLLYGPADPALTLGRKYAIMVQANDPTGISSFRNNGRSEVYSFTYGGEQPLIVGENTDGNTGGSTVGSTGGSSTPPSFQVLNLDGEPDCSCKLPIGSNQTLKDIMANDVITVGGKFQMTVFMAQKSGADQSFSGEGTVPLPAIGGVPGMKLRVVFSGMKVNTDNKMIAGIVRGKVSGDAPSFVPRADTPALPNTSLTSNEVKGVDDYLKSQSSKLISSLKNSVNNAGFELPFGIDKAPVIIGIYSISFNAEQAWFAAATAMDLPDANDRLALQSRAVCMESEGFCKNGILELAEDFAVPGINLTLLQRKAADIYSGTYIVFDSNGFNELAIDSRFTFPNNTLVSVSSGQPLDVNLRAKTQKGWGNWVAEGSLDPFYVDGMVDFKFALAPGKKILFDHSDIANPVGLPASLEFDNHNTLNFSNDWHGFYIPEINISVPPFVRNAKDNKDIVLAATNLVFDKNGFSGIVGVTDVLALADGSADGWYFSIDRIGANFYKSSFISGGMHGRLMLPISGEYKNNAAQKQKEIAYLCNLSKPNGKGLTYEFLVELKNDINFEAWWAKAAIGGGSNIHAIGGSDQSFSLTATLNGSMEIVAEIPKLPNVTLGHVGFKEMKFSTVSGKEFTPGQFSCGIGGAPSNLSQNESYDDYYYLLADNALQKGGPNPSNLFIPAETTAGQSGSNNQQSLMGFNFTVNSIIPYFKDGNVGLTFDTKMQLVNGVDFIPKAELNFSLFANPKGRAGRSWWSSVGGEINAVKLEVNADLAGMKLEGEIRYFDMRSSGSGYTDRGFAGRLMVQLPVTGQTFAMKGMFGSRIASASTFQFFYIDALFDMGSSGIPMFPGTVLHGFAGGAYYNMMRDVSRQKNIAGSGRMSDSENSYATMESFSGVKYSPKSDDISSSFGFMAGIYFGTTSLEVIDCEVSLAMQFANGSLNQISLRGRGAFMNTGKGFEERYKNAMGKATVDIMVQLDEGKFSLFDMTAGVEVKYAPLAAKPFITGRGDMAFRIENNGNWYLKIGRPRPNDPISVSLNASWLPLNLTAETYFECGNYQIDDIPPVPDWIMSIIRNTTTRKEEGNDFSTTAEIAIPPNSGRNDSKGIIMGAAVSLKFNPTFAIFYASLRAGLGVDLSLKNNDGPACSNSPAGASWYAKGQAFLGAEASCGVKVKLFGINKNIEFISAALAAVVEAGLPDPMYAKGAIGGRFSVLDGLISKNFSIKFMVGNMCTMTGNPEEIKLIESISPGDGEEVNTLTRPAVVFNFPVNNDFILPLEYQTKDGDSFIRYRIFRFTKEDVTINLNGGSQRFTSADFRHPDGRNKIAFRGGTPIYSINLGNDNNIGVFLPSTTYTMEARAKVKSFGYTPAVYMDAYNQMSASDQARLEAIKNTNIAAFEYVKTESGSIYEDVKSVQFKTDKGPKRIMVDNVIEMQPYHRQQDLPMRGIVNNRGYLNLYTGMSDVSQFDTQLTNATPVIRFVRADAGEVTLAESNIQIEDGGKKWAFNMPALAPDANYVAKIYFKNTERRTTPQGTNSTTLAVRKSIAFEGGLTAELKKRVLTAESALQMNGGDHELFTWYFRTGKQSTYQQKFKNLKLDRIFINGKEYKRGNQKANLDSLKWSVDEPTKTVTSPTLSVRYNYVSDEYFNKLDETQKRTISLPQVTTSQFINALKNKEWTGMLERWDINTFDFKREEAVWNDFVREAFGPNRELIFKYMTMSGHESKGVASIVTTQDTEFPRMSLVMSSNLFGVNFNNNNYGSSAPATTTSTSSGSTGSSSTTTIGGNKAATTWVTQLYVNQVNLLSAGIIETTNPEKHVFTATVYTTARNSNVGVVEMSNGFVDIISKGGRGGNLPYPTPSMAGLSLIGTAMDKAMSGFSSMGGSIAPPTGLPGTSFNAPRR